MGRNVRGAGAYRWPPAKRTNRFFSHHRPSLPLPDLSFYKVLDSTNAKRDLPHPLPALRLFLLTPCLCDPQLDRALFFQLYALPQRR
jgi:hypothetical protein